MIAVKPGTDAWNVLQLVVDHPGELDAAMVGEALWRPRIRCSADVPRVWAAMREHGASWGERASTLLHRLQARGFIERTRPPALAPDLPTPPARDEDLREWAGVTLSPTALALLAELVRNQPRSMTEWVGAAPTGSTSRAVAQLVEEGIVVPPQRRWPTEAGVAWVAGGVPVARVQRAREAG